MFSILDRVKAGEVLDPVEKFIDWEQFESLASDLVPPRIQINFSKELIKQRATLQPLKLCHMGCLLEK
jgi:hypothetical protein